MNEIDIKNRIIELENHPVLTLSFEEMDQDLIRERIAIENELMRLNDLLKELE